MVCHGDEDEPWAQRRIGRRLSPIYQPYAGHSRKQLLLRQAPLRARVSSGKEKDRKPIDPPPIVQLVERPEDGKNGLYDSPYLLMTCSLVPEHYGQSGAGESLELPSNFLVGTLASSIHRLRDADNAEGGFFVFGDLSVRREGQFRLRFALYDRDGYSPWADYVFVAELISNVFTVFPAKLFPGMGESTALTRAFSDQGVKLRLRREMSGTVAPRRRGHGMGGGGGGGGAVGGGMSKNKYDEAMGDEAARGGLAQAQTQAQQDGGLMLTEAMMMPPMMAEVGVPVCLGPVVGGFPLLAPQGLDEEEAVQLFCYPFEEAAAGRGR